MNKKIYLLLILLFVPAGLFACDLCGCFVPKDSVSHGFMFGVAQQYSSLSDLSLDGSTLVNVADQHFDSFNTQLFAAYHFNEKTALQLNVPLIYRSFQRLEEDGIQKGTESGFGDVLLVASYIPFQRKNPYSQFQLRMLGGVKFPTGDSSRIGEELEEDHHDEVEAEHAVEELSAVHGHDLALGSGSWDLLIGTNLFGRNGKWFYTGNIQYAIRTRGDFDYRYANDLLWYGGPGYYVSSSVDWPVGLQLLLSGEHKGEDELGNVKADDTAVTSVFVEPTAIIGLKQIGTAEIGFAFPLSIDNSGLQTVPNFRLRMGITWKFQ
jgi:hypothetical protein